MKVYCQTCKEYVLDTSDKFVIGGQYNGSMFQAPVQSRYHVDSFMFKEWVVYGDLFCPRCDQSFIINGVILTEHGLIKEGQKSLDTEFFVIHTEGEHKNQLKSAVIWSLEGDFEGFEPEEVEDIPPPEFPGTFGEQVKQARENAGFSMAALAKSIKVSASTLKNWEKDKTKPSKKNLKKLKTALNI